MSRMRCGYPPEARLLRKLDRIAIWNKNKIIYIISMGIWTANIGVVIYGKYLR
jgi:hypothetical protein